MGPAARSPVVDAPQLDRPVRLKQAVLQLTVGSQPRRCQRVRIFWKPEWEARGLHKGSMGIQN